jgi:excisionase family DNA binding protein
MESNQRDREPELMLVPEAARFLRLQPNTIRSWILHRRIPYLKLGGRVCLRRADLDALVERSLVSATSNRQEGFKSADTSPPTRDRDRNTPPAPTARGGAR